MTTDRRLEQLVADTLRASAPAAAPDDLVRDVLRDARRTRRRQRWVALLTERPMVRRPMVLVGSPTARAASIALAVILAAVVGTLVLVAGGLPQRRDAIVVLPNPTAAPTSEPTSRPTPGQTGEPEPTPTETVQPGGLVLYGRTELVPAGEGACIGPAPGEFCTAFSWWISNADGTGAHPFVIDDPALWSPVSWWPDGSGVLAHDLEAARVALIDASGHVLRRWDLGPCPIEGFCQPEPGSASLSPDATRLVFDWKVEDYRKSRTISALSMLDLETGAVTEVPGTRSVNRGAPCWTSATCEGLAQTPRWSPDGAHLVFTRLSMSPEPGSPWTSAAVFTVRADGSDLRRVTPEGTVATDASWSPDGSTIAFTKLTMAYDKEDDDVTATGQDIYTIGPDGMGLHRLTNDGSSSAARWTADGRLAFFRDDGSNWIMDADGGAQAELGFDLGTLTSAGCVSCRYPEPRGTFGEALWQPLP